MGEISGFRLLTNPEEYINQSRYYGLWRGVVEDVSDPDYRGRIKVRVQGVHNRDPNLIPTQCLPWAHPNAPISGNKFGSFTVPYTIGDSVHVMFIAGNKLDPVYMGSWWGMDKDSDFKDPETPDEAWQVCDKNGNPTGVPKDYDTYPKRSVIKSPHGMLFEMSDEPKDYEIILKTPGGQTIWLRESPSANGKGVSSGVKIEDGCGNVIEMNSETLKVSITASGPCEITSAQGVVVTAATTAEVTAATVTLRGAGAGTPGGVVTGGLLGTYCPFSGMPHIDESVNVKATKV